MHLLAVNAFPAHITAVFLQNASKILSKMSKEKNEDFFNLCDEVVDRYLPHFLTNEDLEVQERASSLLQIIQIIKSEDIDIEQMFFAYALNPVAAKAQRKVPVPVGLDLDLPFVEFDETDSEEERIDEMTFVDEEEEEEIPLTEEQIQKNIKTSEERRAQMDNNPNYLKPSSKKKKKKHKKDFEVEVEAQELIETAEEVVVNNTNQNASNTIPGLISSQNFLKKTKHKKTKKKSRKRIEEEEEEEPEVQHLVTIKGLEMPEGFEANDVESDEDIGDSTGDPHKALAKITFSESDFVSPKYVSKQSKALDSYKLEDNKKKKKTSKKDKTNEEKEEKKTKKKKTKSKTIENGDNLLLDEPIETINEKTTTTKKKTKKADRPKSLELNGEKKKTKKKTKLKAATVLEPTEETDLTRKRDEYEETAGIETPSLFVPLQSSIQSEPSETPAVESQVTQITAQN